MRNSILLLALTFSLTRCSNKEVATPPVVKPPVDTVVSTFPHPDHIIFVWFENKGSDSILGSSSAPYINSLIAQGTLFTNTSAITHPSYPNYVAFFGADQNGITNDKCVETMGLTTPNLFTNLNEVGKSFAWYSEGLPETGSKACFAPNSYVAKHNPTTIFSNVPASANKRFADFPSNYDSLENVVCISPNLNNDMHDGSVAKGDDWLKSKMSSLIEWCKTHNSIFVVYYDENDGGEGNKIPVVAVGEPVMANFADTTSYDHYNWTRTVSKMFSANETWTTNLSSREAITSCWKK